MNKFWRISLIVVLALALVLAAFAVNVTGPQLSVGAVHPGVGWHTGLVRPDVGWHTGSINFGTPMGLVTGASPKVGWRG